MPSLGNQIINIISSRVIKENSSDGLNKFKRFICRLFSISPAKLYWYEIEISTEYIGNVKLNDLVMGADEVRWIVTKIDGYKLTIKSVRTDGFRIRGVYGTMICFGNCFREQ